VRIHPAVEAAVAEVGFACACGVCDGFNTAATSLFALRRIEIHGTDSLLRFIVKLLTGRRNPDRGGGRALVRRRTSAPR